MDNVIRTQPTTPAGLAALTGFARNMAERSNRDAGFGEKQWIPAIAAVDDAARGMSGLQPWSPPASAPTPQDPIFEVIRAKREADDLHGRAIDAQDVAEKRHGAASDAVWEANERSEAACWAAHEVDWRIARTAPTTLSGVAALLRLANQIEDEGGEWPGTDTIGAEGWHYQLRATMAQAIETIIRKGDV